MSDSLSTELIVKKLYDKINITTIENLKRRRDEELDMISSINKAIVSAGLDNDGKDIVLKELNERINADDQTLYDSNGVNTQSVKSFIKVHSKKVKDSIESKKDDRIVTQENKDDTIVENKNDKDEEKIKKAEKLIDKYGEGLSDEAKKELAQMSVQAQNDYDLIKKLSEEKHISFEDAIKEFYNNDLDKIAMFKQTIKMNQNIEQAEQQGATEENKKVATESVKETNEMIELRKTIATMKEHYEELKRSLNGEIQNLNDEIAKYNRRIEEYLKEIEYDTQTITSTEGLIIDKIGYGDEKSIAHAEVLKNQVQGLKTDIQGLKQKIDELTQRIGELQASIDEKNRMLEQEENNIRQKENRLNELRNNALNVSINEQLQEENEQSNNAVKEKNDEDLLNENVNRKKQNLSGNIPHNILKIEEITKLEKDGYSKDDILEILGKVSGVICDAKNQKDFEKRLIESAQEKEKDLYTFIANLDYGTPIEDIGKNEDFSVLDKIIGIMESLEQEKTNESQNRGDVVNVQSQLPEDVSAELNAIPVALQRINCSPEEITEGMEAYKQVIETLTPEEIDAEPAMLAETLKKAVGERGLDGAAGDILKMMSQITFNGQISEILKNCKDEFMNSLEILSLQGPLLDPRVYSVEPEQYSESSTSSVPTERIDDETLKAGFAALAVDLQIADQTIIRTEELGLDNVNLRREDAEVDSSRDEQDGEIIDNEISESEAPENDANASNNSVKVANVMNMARKIRPTTDIMQEMGKVVAMNLREQDGPQVEDPTVQTDEKE